MEKREITTKQLIVPAKYMIKCIANNENTTYPVNVSVLGRFSSSHQFNCEKELRDAANSRMFFENSVCRILKRKGHFELDLRTQGLLIVDKNVLPMRKHMDTLTEIQVKELFEIMFGEQN